MAGPKARAGLMAVPVNWEPAEHGELTELQKR